MQKFGAARDYITVKLFHIEEVEPQDFDWSEETAYVGPRTPLEPRAVREVYEIQFIDTESGQTLRTLTFTDYEEAKLKYNEIIDDLSFMEIQDFGRKYELELEEHGNLL